MKNPRCGLVNHIGGFSYLDSVCPVRICLEDMDLAPVGEGDAAGEKLGRGQLVPGAVFVVTNQREATGRKLDPDLVGAAGM